MELESTGDLVVSGELRGPLGTELEIDASATPFLTNVMVETKRGLLPVQLGKPGWGEDCGYPCNIHYRFALGRAAKTLSDVEVAWASGAALFAPPSTWLLHPDRVTPDGEYRLHVKVPPPDKFITALRGGSGKGITYEGPAVTLAESPFSGFGPLAEAKLRGPDARAVLGPALPVPEDTLTSWLDAELDAITQYFGRPPDDRLVLFVVRGTSEVNRGETLGGGGASVFIRLGTKVASAEDLREDWVVAHELVHVSMPSTGYEHQWFSEGLACYIEPIARVQAGLLSPEKMWSDLVLGMPQGLPKEGDHGLEGSTEWGRIYWGGTLFFLLADLEIREKSGNTRSLRDAVRSVAKTGANVEQRWPLQRVLDTMDAGTGLSVLRELYDRLGRTRGDYDLDGLWRRLGVRTQGKSVQFDDAAPWAALRAALTARP